MRRHHILIPLAALLAISPLLFHGCSCGHDFDFHLQSWLDAAQQLRHGTYPHWTYSAAFNAGEPRFVFYPPISWLLGALLTLIFPIAATPAIYTCIALTAAGFAMHHLARHFVSPNAALLASCLYLANPYMLFTAYERTAYAELLAAAWIPLLLLSVFRARPTIRGIAIPIALLWLTNAPAAVMGCYTFAIIAIVRLIQSRRSQASPSHLTITFIAGTALGLALPAFYLIPAAYERRYVQIAMAIIPNMRFQDNFLFGHTADIPHNIVLHTASVLAITLLTITAVTLIGLFLIRKHSTVQIPNLFAPLTVLTLLIAFLLTPISTPIWNHLPNLAFLQFPWRLLTILSAILAFSLALLFDRLQSSGAPFIGWLHHGMSGKAILFAAPIAVLALSLLCIHLYRQPCDPADTPTATATAFNTHHGVLPTDEYTPADADNDVLRPNNPGYWLSTDPQAFAPRTTPNPGATDPNFDGTFPPEETISTPAPRHLEIHANQPGYLILNLRDYPNWDVTQSDPNSMELERHPHIHRDDGLIALQLFYPAEYYIDISWRTTSDEQLGYAITASALLALALTFRRSRKII